ncbi:hypothetical protein [Brevibacterium litoralis]|uniref:hypothetical protein n=1 Tax=Brevibacterium litoralis TaxID=3138935 RepID=UPI0032EC9DA8
MTGFTKFGLWCFIVAGVFCLGSISGMALTELLTPLTLLCGLGVLVVSVDGICVILTGKDRRTRELRAQHD